MCVAVHVVDAFGANVNGTAGVQLMLPESAFGSVTDTPVNVTFPVLVM